MKASGAARFFFGQLAMALGHRHPATDDHHHCAALDFALWLSCDQIETLDPKGKPKLVPFAQMWLKSPQATRCNSVIFNPAWGAITPPNVFNFFRGELGPMRNAQCPVTCNWHAGFSTQPDATGSCSKLLKHHAEVLCNGGFAMHRPPTGPMQAMAMVSPAISMCPHCCAILGDTGLTHYSLSWWARCALLPPLWPSNQWGAVPHAIQHPPTP